MPTLEERVAYLEGKVGDIARLDADVRDVRDAIAHLDQKFDARIDALDKKFDTRINALDQKFDSRFGIVDSRFNALDQKIDRLYLFVLGTLAASIGSLIGVILTLMRLPR